MNYPERCIRGIRAKDHISDDGLLLASAIEFVCQDGRSDNMAEASINWEDGPEVIDFTLDQRKKSDNEVEFKVGVALIPKQDLDRIRRAPHLKAFFLSYERAELPGNPYHGNILISGNTGKKTRIQIAGAISIAAEIIRRSPTE